MSTPRSRSVHAGSACAGFGLIELMIAMTLSLVLLSGVVALFVGSRKSYESNEHLARIQENGRFALEMLQRDLRSAGYLGCARGAPFNNTLKTPTSVLWNFAAPLTGFESTGTTWAPAIDTTLVPSAAAVNSDVLVVRTPDPEARAKRVATLMGSSSAQLTVTPAAPLYSSGQALLVTDCSAVSIFEVTAYTAAGVISHAIDSTATTPAGALAAPGNSTADLGYAFTQGSTVVPMQTIIYYVRASATAGNGNSLWRRLGRDAPTELVEGVDSLQVLYGVDTTGDRVVDGEYDKANAVSAANWANVVSVRIGLLVRSVEQYGNNADTAHTVLGQPIPAAADNRERLVFSTTVALRNEAL